MQRALQQAFSHSTESQKVRTVTFSLYDFNFGHLFLETVQWFIRFSSRRWDKWDSEQTWYK